MPRYASDFTGGLMGGVSKFAQSLLGGDRAQQQGFDQELQAQTKIGQALAQMQADQARARHADAEAGFTGSKQRVLDSRPALFEEQAALQGGVTVPQLQAFRERTRTGVSPQVPMGPETEDGSMGVGSAQFGPETASKIVGAIKEFLPLLANSGDLNPDQMADAAAKYRGSRLSDAIIAGTADRNTVGGAQAAAAGKDLFNRDSTGSVLDQFRGTIETANPVAQATIRERNALANERNAQAERHRAETAGGGFKPPAGYRLKTGGAPGELEPIPGGPADPESKGAKQVKPPTEGQAKALIFGSRMAVAQEILDELAQDGAIEPSRVKQFAESLPLVGTGAGMVANMAATSKEQLVEQAQRDFINAVLRRESGAVISPQEFANAARQYFPQPGDSPEVLAQKKANRQVAIDGMKAEFGQASSPQFDEIVGRARMTRQAAKKPGQSLTSMPLTPSQGRPPLSSFNRGG